MNRRVVGLLGAVALLFGVAACSSVSEPESAEPVEWLEQYDPNRPTQHIYYEADPETISVSQIVEPKAGEDEGSAVIYIPPLNGEYFTIWSLSTGKGGLSRTTLCEFPLSYPMPDNGSCHMVAYAGRGDAPNGEGYLHGGSHIRVDGLLRGEHKLEVAYWDRDSSGRLDLLDAQVISFEVPQLHR